MSSQHQHPSQLPNAISPGPGILFVLSTVLPSTPPLSREAFCNWYESTHVQEVQSTGCISSTQRYERLSFRGGSANKRCEYDFLTVYHMPDLADRETEAFRGLDGQSQPRGEVLEGLFRKVEFVTRFAGIVAAEPAGGGGEERRTRAPFVVTVAREGVGVPDLRGVGRVLRYRVHEGSRLRRFERSWMDEPREMMIVEVESEEGVAAVAEALRGAEGLEVGFWGLRRGYDGSERTPRGWNPPADG